MLCPYCGTYSASSDIVCPACGRLLPHGENHDAGVQAIRQGKRAREDAAKGRSAMQDQRQGQSRAFSDTMERANVETPVYTDPDVMDEESAPQGVNVDRPARVTYRDGAPRERQAPPSLRKDKHPVRQKQINWAKMTVAAVVLFIGLCVGVFLFLTRSAGGQRIMARMGMTAPSSALWEVGAERMDVGDVEAAIDFFERAAVLDGEENVSVPGLLQLGGAYESAGRLDDAEALYTRIYTDIVPSATEAYTNVIRIMLADGREPEAAELMRLAYDKTGSATFMTQRTQLLPQPPVANPVAGFYEEVKTLTLTSEQGFDIYYTFEDEEHARLPEDGVKYEAPLRLDENTWPLRAVCVNGNLVSDELSATYRISMPSPGTPYPSLATNTYKQRQKLRIYQNIERDNDPNITIYYTIDGSMPNADSPIYTGEPFWLPGGRVTLHAVSVNEYGKASNTLTVEYKIEAKPYPLSAYTVDDTASGLRLNMTTYDEFIAAYGAPSSTDEVQRPEFEGTVRKMTYDWGYALFHTYRGSQTLVEVYFTSGPLKAPRSTDIGDSVDKVIGKYCDMGQVESPSGNRGLYSNSSGTGRMYINGNGTDKIGEENIIYPAYPVDAKVIRYTTNTADSHVWQLDYIAVNNKVAAIRMLFIP